MLYKDIYNGKKFLDWIENLHKLEKKLSKTNF